MAKVRSQSADALSISALADGQAADAVSALSARIRATAEKKGWNQSRLAAESKVPAGRISEYWTGKREPGANYLFAVAEALSVPAEWLVTGRNGSLRQSDANHLAAVEAADFYPLPRYEFDDIDEKGKGLSVERIPTRRDWLNRRYGKAADLWVVELPLNYSAAAIEEGDVVLCSDLRPGQVPLEGWTCLMLGESRPFIRTFRDRAADGALYVGDRLDELVVTPSELRDGDLRVIARIRGKMFMRL